jgi:DNA-binding NarL/FixJ family response regulator
VRLRRHGEIEAARRIRKLAPGSKILFVSQESSCDVMEEAFNLGVMGYVIKSNAQSDLLPAVDQVIIGKQLSATD